MSERESEIRGYLARWGIAPTSIAALISHPCGAVYRANGDAGGDLYVILDAGPPAHFPVHFWDEGEPWRAILRWYHGGDVINAAEAASGYNDPGGAPDETSSAAPRRRVGNGRRAPRSSGSSRAD